MGKRSKRGVEEKHFVITYDNIRRDSSSGMQWPPNDGSPTP